MVYQREDIVKKAIKLPALAAGALKQYSDTCAELHRVLSQYGYMTGFNLVNNSSAEVEIRLDGMRAYPCPSAMVIGDDNTHFSWFEIENVTTATAINADEITITVLNEVVSERVVNTFFRKIMGMARKTR